VRSALPGAGMTVITLLVAFLVLYPLSMLLYGSFRTSRPGAPGSFTLQNYIEAYTSVETLSLLLTTILLMGAKTVVATVVAMALAFALTRTDTPLRSLLEVLIAMPFFIPPILEAIGWIMLLSPRTGTINVALGQLFGSSMPRFSIYSLGGMIWVLSLGSTAFMFLLLVNALRNIDTSLEEAARVAGASPLRVATRVTLPLVAPAILGVSLLSFIRALESFEVPVLIGLPAKVFVFPNRIYAAVEQDYPPNYGLATALGVSFILLTLGLVVLQGRILRGKQFFVISGKSYRPQVAKIGPAKYLICVLCFSYFLVATLLPLSQLLLGSVSRTFGRWSWAGLTLANYSRVLADSQLWAGLRNTLLLGLTAAALSMVLCSLVAYIVTRTRYPARKSLDFISWIPWTIPGVVVGLGMLWAYIRFPIPIYGTMVLIGIAFVTSGLPLGVRLMSGVMVQIDTELEESSRVHGAGWATTYRRILLPLLRPAMAAGIIILFVTFARSLSSIVFLAGPGTPMLSVVLFKYFSTSNLEIVCALAMIMLAINVTGLVLARRLGFFGSARASV